MKYVTKECPGCSEKMVLLTANFHFRPKLPFNFHCDKCGKILEYGMEQFSVEAKSVKNDDLAKLFPLLLQ
jgi:hypothetical protein